MVRNSAEGDRIALTVRQVAQALHVSTSTVYAAVAEGRIPHVRVGSAIRIPVQLIP